MSDNNSSANGNSWTILAPEVKESGVESVGPLAEDQEGSGCSKLAQPKTEEPGPKDTFQRSEFTDGLEEHDAPEPPQVAPLESNDDAAALHTSLLKEPNLSATPVENLSCLTSDPEQQGTSAGHTESENLNRDADTFSDSYTHISLSPESGLHLQASQVEEGLSKGEDNSELRKILREEFKPDDVSEEKGSEGDGVRRRKVPLLAPVHHRDDEEEEEGEEEPFRAPQREEDAGFSLNKCIFGALILLGLGTVFFSGVLMDLDDEGDADVKELKNPELQKEWMNLDASRTTPAGVQSSEILESLAKKSQQLAVLQAQLQEQEGELKAAQQQVEEGTKERMRREELEVENERMRGELDKLPALQKEFEQESEKARRDLEALPVMQKELELLRAKVTELAESADGAQAVPLPSASAVPSAGQEREVSATQWRKDLKHKKPQEKVREEKERSKELKEGRERRKDMDVKEGATEGKKSPEGEKEEWRVKGERKEQKDERQAKKGEKKHEDGKRWKEFNEEDGKRDSKKEGKRWKEFDEGGKRGSKKEGKRWKEFDEGGKRDSKDDGKRWKEFDEGGKRGSKDDGKRWKEFDEGGKRGSKDDGKRWKEFGEGGKRDWKDDGKRWKEFGEEDGKRDSKKEGKRWKEFDEGGKRGSKDDGKRWKEFDEGGKRGSKDDGKRWKEFDEGGKRGSKDDGKRWKDGDVKEETGKQHWKGDKTEKHWQLDGGRWETKEWKKSAGKEKKNKEMKLGDDLKYGKDEREWKRGREVDSNNHKEQKEKNDRKNGWKEGNEWGSAKQLENPEIEGKVRKENAWKEEKDHHKEHSGRKEWKEHEDKYWRGKEKEWSKDGDRTEDWKEEKKHKGDYQKTGEKWSRKDKFRHSSQDHVPYDSYDDRKRSENHGHDNYWAEQRERIRHYRGSTEGCSGVTACAHGEGLTPVGQHDFEALLSAYLTKLLVPEGRASNKEELNKLIGEFFANGVFVHDQIPFGEFVEDVADILEDMAEEEEDDELEDEMEEFVKEAMEKFALLDQGGNDKKMNESKRKRASG